LLIELEDKKNETLHLDRLACLKAYQRRGIGREMVENTIAVMGHMTITTRAKLSAVSFYEQFGFKTIEDDLTFTQEVEDNEWDWLGDSDNEDLDDDNEAKEHGYVNMVRFGVSKKEEDKK
jgi:ribosomal protein S18 acetylase RimI-like enzyme